MKKINFLLFYMLEQVSKMAISHVPGSTYKILIKFQSVYVKRIRKTLHKLNYTYKLLNTLKFRCLNSEKVLQKHIHHLHVRHTIKSNQNLHEAHNLLLNLFL